MAIIKCPDCKKEISSDAESCLNCGKPIKPKASVVKQILIGLGFFIAFAVLILGILLLLISEGNSTLGGIGFVVLVLSGLVILVLANLVGPRKTGP